MKALIKLLSVLCICFSSLVFAHVHLEKSVPADNAMLMTAPELLTLSFSKEVRVVKVLLKNSQGQVIKFGFKPSNEAVAEFSWQLPKLEPAGYSVELVFLGNDGHKMNKNLSFMVH